MKRILCAAVVLLMSVAARPQDLLRSKAWVSMVPAALTNIDRGSPGMVQLQFRVTSGFHINSNQPKQDYLKKTELKLDAPTDIVIGRITYPAGPGPELSVCAERQVERLQWRFRSWSNG